jgi:hypothetical protein
LLEDPDIRRLTQSSRPLGIFAQAISHPGTRVAKDAQDACLNVDDFDSCPSTPTYLLATTRI